MPTYEFKDADGEYFEAAMTIAEKKQFLDGNPDIKQVFTVPPGIHYRKEVKADGWLKDRLDVIADAHPHSELANRRKRRTGTEVKRDEIAKKHFG